MSNIITDLSNVGITFVVPAPPPYVWRDEFNNGYWWSDPFNGEFAGGQFRMLTPDVFAEIHSANSGGGEGKFKIDGLFDISLDLDILSVVGNPIIQFNLEVINITGGKSKDTATIGITNDGGIHKYRAHTNDETSLWDPTGGGVTIPGSFRWRIRRNVDNRAVIYVWENDMWQWDGDPNGIVMDTPIFDDPEGMYVKFIYQNQDEEYFTWACDRITLWAGTFTDITP